MTVAVGHDDLLVGYRGKTHWYEVKTGPRAEIKQSQAALLDNWQGHYKIVWTAQMILTDIGFQE